jgi:hypothetical protein
MNGVDAGAACGNPATKSGGSGGGDSRRVYKRAREPSTPASKVRGATAFGWIEIKLLHGIDSIIDCYIGEISQIQKSETSTPGWEQKFRLVFDAGATMQPRSGSFTLAGILGENVTAQPRRAVSLSRGAGDGHCHLRRNRNSSFAGLRRCRELFSSSRRSSCFWLDWRSRTYLQTSDCCRSLDFRRARLR